MNDIDLHLTDLNVLYVTAIGVVPADVTGDPGSIRAALSTLHA